MIATTETVGVRLARGLRAAGVGHVFGVPGGQTLPLYGGILETPGIEHVLMRDERGAACAADAYSRITGRVGVCDATVGPGATNLVSGIAEAYGSSVAVLAIIADIPRDWEHRRTRGNASQALDQASMFTGISKWVARVTSAAALDDCLRVAPDGCHERSPRAGGAVDHRRRVRRAGRRVATRDRARARSPQRSVPEHGAGRRRGACRSRRRGARSWSRAAGRSRQGRTTKFARWPSGSNARW